MTTEEKARTREAQRIWREKNREKDRNYKRKSFIKNKDRFMLLQRDRDYKKRYGITLEEYNSILKIQDGKCLICGLNKGGPKTPNLAVDHDHTTGKVRGLLCVKCNGSLGWYEMYRYEIKKYLDHALVANYINELEKIN